MPDLDKMMIFIDGENIVFRYQNMLKKGAKPHPSVVHEPDIYAWNPMFPPTIGYYNILRATYYTYATGDDTRLDIIRDQISTLSFHRGPSKLPDRLTPQVFKKPKQSAQKKGVDIQMTVDVLTHIYNNSTDAVYFVSGDGDYRPLLEEVKRYGKQLYLAALSDGFNRSLRYLADNFLDLDGFFFANP